MNMLVSKTSHRWFLTTSGIAVLMTSLPICSHAQAPDSLAVALESARRTRDESQLQSLKAQFEQRVSQNSKDADAHYQLALVQGYLTDVYELRKDKRSASRAVDHAIDSVQHSLEINDKSADAHSLLADLYGRKISLSNPMFAGPKYGPKVDEQNKRAMALDDKNPRVWASLGRQYLMTPNMFGGDVARAIDSFQKSLALDSQQDEVYLWLAKAYEKHGEKSNAREAIQHALQLNPQSPLGKAAISTLH